MSPLLIGVLLTLGPVGLSAGSGRFSDRCSSLRHCRCYGSPMRLAVAIADPSCKRSRRHFGSHWQCIPKSGEAQLLGENKGTNGGIVVPVRPF